MRSVLTGNKRPDRHGEILECAATLYIAFERLRYANGGISRARALVAAGAVRALKRCLIPDMQLEERVLFPYISKHVPRLEALLFYFCTEHEDFRLMLSKLHRAAAGLVAGKKMDDAALDELYFAALHLVSHLKTHIQSEKNELYGVIGREFKDHEKAVFCKLAGVSGMQTLKKGLSLYAIRGTKRQRA